MNSLPRFFRYLPRDPALSQWGAAVLDAGFGTVPPGVDYPLPGHPEDHEFSWETGRILSAYTFVYITAGRGVFDSGPCGLVTVEAGTILLVFPNVWHRYRPDPKTGWDEYWVECEGELLEAVIRRAALGPDSPVMRVGHDDALLRCFMNIAETIQQNAPGFEAVIAMRSLEIVARVRSLLKVANSEGSDPAEKLVRQIQMRMRESLSESIDFQRLAAQHGLSYSSFRRMFKQVTGRPPGDYFIEMKIKRARQLLLADHPVKEVADLLGFESVCYFSRLFKARTGLAPSEMRSGRIAPGKPLIKSSGNLNK
jgi:AraC-like DNA-binding protein